MRLGVAQSRLNAVLAKHVAAAIHKCGYEVELVPIASQDLGDNADGDAPSIFLGSPEVVQKRKVLLQGGCDLIVHGVIEMPLFEVPGIASTAIPFRDNSHDVLCSSNKLGLDELPTGSSVGVSSVLRAAQLRIARPDVVAVSLRGDTIPHLQRLKGAGLGHVTDLDALIIAQAKLAYGDQLDLVAEEFDGLHWRTEVGQGAVAVEVRERDLYQDPQIAAVMEGINNRVAYMQVLAERETMRALDVGYEAPIGFHSTVEGDTLVLRASAFSATGAARIDAQSSTRLDGTPEDEQRTKELAKLVAQSLKQQGVFELIASQRLPQSMSAQAVLGKTPVAVSGFGSGELKFERAHTQIKKPLSGITTIVARPPDSTLCRELRELGAQVIASVLSSTTPLPGMRVAKALDKLANGGYDWVIFMSPRAVTSLVDAGYDMGEVFRKAYSRGVHIAVEGDSVARAVRRAGGWVDLMPHLRSAEGVVLELQEFVGSRMYPTALMPSSLEPDPVIVTSLEASGWTLDFPSVYALETLPALPGVIQAHLEACVEDPQPTVFIATAPVIARAGAALFPEGRRPTCVAIGPKTAQTLCELGWEPDAQAVSGEDLPGVILRCLGR
ncbi:MAG: uroporphyrinogen-III synthase [Actinomycetaceae bacterium]|nr:uroporphyrinogen-III synthase [Actinomycetaceae bacterium]